MVDIRLLHRKQLEAYRCIGVHDYSFGSMNSAAAVESAYPTSPKQVINH